MDNSAIASTLRKLANEIGNFRPHVIGEHISVSVSGPGAGSVIGKSVSFSVGPGNFGNVVGSHISVVAGPRDPEELRLAQDLQQEADKAEAGNVDKPRIQSLLKKAGSFASATVTAVTRGVVEALMG